MTYVPIPNLQARALPAAGAYYTSATPVGIQGSWLENHDGAPTITFRVAYTAGGSGGYPVMRVVWRVFDDTGTEVDVPDTITTVATGGVCTTDPATNKLVALTNGNPLVTSASYVVPRDSVKVRVEVAELGNEGAPGTVTVAMIGRL